MADKDLSATMYGMERDFCHVCATKLEKQKDNMWYCKACDQDYYSNPNPCVELAVFNDKGEVMLAERGNDPWKGKYDMPGGFIDLDERAEEAVLREVKEELDFDTDDVSKPIFVRTYLGNYPWGKEMYKNIILLFAAHLKTDKEAKPQDDVAGIKWVKPEDIDRSDLSIPDLYMYIQEARDALK